MIHRPFTCTKSHGMHYAGQLEVWSLQTPFSFCSLLSLFPLSSFILMNSNPPVPSPFPLTYKFLIENPVSLLLFLESPFTLLLQFLRYCCIMKSQTTLWAQSVLLLFSCFLFSRSPFREPNLWFPLFSQFWPFPADMTLKWSIQLTYLPMVSLYITNN